MLVNKNRKTRILFVTFFFITLGFLFLTISSSSFNATDTPVPVIVVPGGGLTPTGSLPEYVVARMDAAVDMFMKLKHRKTDCGFGPCMITLSAGTPHIPPPRDANGFPLYESSVGAKYLLAKNVPFENIYEEKVSLDTVGNAYFLRTIHTDPRGWKNLVIITNSWHISRVRCIFDKIYGLASTPFSTLKRNKYNIQYIAVDALLPESVLNLRLDREAKSLQKFIEQTAPSWHTLQDVHQFMFQSHDAYSSKRFAGGFAAEKIDTELKESY